MQDVGGQLKLDAWANDYTDSNSVFACACGGSRSNPFVRSGCPANGFIFGVGSSCIQNDIPKC